MLTNFLNPFTLIKEFLISSSTDEDTLIDYSK